MQANKGKLNLTPNEIVGYKIHPDQWNWKVVVVKKHGEESKNSGKEYETTLAYCKSIYHAVSYIVNYVSAIEGEKEQKLTFEKEGLISDINSLKVGFEKAETAALAAVKDLEVRLEEAGYSFAKIAEEFKTLRPTENEQEDTED